MTKQLDLHPVVTAPVEDQAVADALRAQQANNQRLLDNARAVSLQVDEPRYWARFLVAV